MTKKVFFIFNLKAGKSKIANKLAEIIDLYIKNGYEITVHSTQNKFDAYQVVKDRAYKYDIIVCSGGDGTLNEVVKGVLESKRRPLIGFIPAGTTNDFANSLKLFRDIQKSAETVINGVPFLCDVGLMNETPFTYVAAFGLFTDVSYQTPQSSKNLLGHMAYILEGAKRLGNIKSYHMVIENDEQTIEDDFMLGMITNSTSIAGFKGLAGEGVKMDDGLFEVSLIKMPRNPIEFQIIINSMLSKQANTDLIYTFRSSNVIIHSEQPVDWTLDGEFGGEHTDVHIKNMKQAITVIRPLKKS